MGVALAIGAALDILLLGTYAGELSEPARTIALVLGIGVVALAIANARSFRDSFDAFIVVALLLFLAACVVSSFLRQSLDAAVSALFYAAALLIARRYLEEDASRRLLLTSLALIGTGVAIAVATLWLITWALWLTAARFSILPPLDLDLSAGIYGYRHHIAILLMLLLPAMISLFRDGRYKLLRIPILLGLAAVAFDVFAAGSRNIWLSAGLAGFVATAPHLRQAAVKIRSEIHGLRLVMAAVIVTSGGLLVAGQVVPRLLNVQTLSARAELWTASLDLFLDRPLQGFGPGSYPFLLRLSGYFEQNAYAPRHPDNAVLQLMAEAGALGLAAAAVVVAALLREWWHRRNFDSRPLFALSFFGFVCMAAGPTDYGFLVMPVLLWTAFAFPACSTHLESRSRDELRPHPTHRIVRTTTFAAGLIIVVALSSTAAAALAVEDARVSLANGRPPDALAAMNFAVNTDPGLAIYWRMRGELQLAQGDAAAATSDLERASETNLADTAALRSLALAYLMDGNSVGANAASARAVELQRSDLSNVIVDAYVASQTGDRTRAEKMAIEAIQQDPILIADERWVRILQDRTLGSVIARAAASYGTAEGSTVGVGLRGLRASWLAALTHDPRLISLSLAESPPALADIGYQFAQTGLCDPQLMLKSLRNPSSAAITDSYWQTRLITEALTKTRTDIDTVRLASLESPVLGQLASEMVPLETISGDSHADVTGYGRVGFPDTLDAGLPNHIHALNLWLKDPDGTLDRLARDGVEADRCRSTQGSASAKVQR